MPDVARAPGPKLADGVTIRCRWRPGNEVGVPREVKNHEYRVALTPAGVTELLRATEDIAAHSGEKCSRLSMTRRTALVR